MLESGTCLAVRLKGERTAMNTDRNIAFGALALEVGAIDAAQFHEACADWARDRRTPLADLLVARGWISPEQRARLDRELRAQNGATVAGTDPGGLPTTLAAPDADRVGLTTEVAPGSAGPDDRDSAGASTVAESAVSATAAMATTVDFGGSGGAQADQSTVAIEGGPQRVAPLGTGGEPTERYTRTRLHARGGIGQVWLARDDSLGREVALKELRPDRLSDGASWARFLEEARVTGQLEHPGIVPVYELSRDTPGQNPFYTMRFVRGRTLGEAIQEYHERRRAGRAGPLDRAALLEAFVGVCNAVAYAHSRGVIHRDIKGQNVILGDFGEVMVLDWGLAKHVQGPAEPAGADAGRGGEASPVDATLPGQVLGTPAYMAPEQAAGRPDLIGPRTDVYALGAVLYEILTGGPPFRAETVTELLRQVREDTPPRPRTVNPEAPPALEAVCLKAMAKAPEGRYAQATDLAREVRRWLADEPVEAYPEPWTKRAARWARRHRPAVAAAAAVLVIAAGALGVTSIIVRRERDEARQQREIARTAVNDMYTGVAEDWLEDYLDPLQHDFLERALAYYQKFAGPMAGQAPVRRETALALLRVGDIHRKLGRDDEAERSYREAMTQFASLAPLGRDDALHQARLRARIGALLVAVGRHDEAEPLLSEARADQEGLLPQRSGDAQAAFDLARTCREQANLDRIRRRNSEARAAYDRGVAVLEPIVAAQPKLVEPRRELGTVLARLGQLLVEVGDEAAAEATLRRGLTVLEPLLTEFPTNPRIREGLADTLDNLGRLLRRKPGAAEEAEARLKLAVDHYQRLAEDFPGRPEYQRLLSRGWVNLGVLYTTSGRLADAEPAFRRAAETLRVLRDRIPDEPKVHRDLGIALNNLGSTLEQTGRAEDAATEFRHAIAIQEEMVAKHPDVPDFQNSLASDLLNLASVLRLTEGPDETDGPLQRAQNILETLVTKHPDMPEYRAELARVLGLRGVVLSQAGGAQAEPLFRAAVEAYDRLVEAHPDDLSLRASLADTLTNFAELKIDGRRVADARALGERSVALYRDIARDAPDDAAVQVNLGTVLVNLGESLAEAGKPEAAAPVYEQAAEVLGPLAARPNAAPEVHHRFAYLLTNQGKLLLGTGQPAEAKTSLKRAIAEQRVYLEALKLPISRSTEWQEQNTLLARATVAEGQHREAAEIAVRIPKEAPSRPEARVEAARLLSRCAALAETDGQLSEAQRSPLAQLYADRAVAQLRVAIDSGYQLPEPLEDDPDFSPLHARPDFQNLVAAAPPQPEE
jgi:tetratricopeptide (TPR) repeat protein/tRNA A-37 threonylcarbamoyl transferase component Bud32